MLLSSLFSLHQHKPPEALWRVKGGTHRGFPGNRKLTLRGALAAEQVSSKDVSIYLRASVYRGKRNTYRAILDLYFRIDPCRHMELEFPCS